MEGDDEECDGKPEEGRQAAPLVPVAVQSDHGLMVPGRWGGGVKGFINSFTQGLKSGGYLFKLYYYLISLSLQSISKSAQRKKKLYLILLKKVWNSSHNT